MKKTTTKIICFLLCALTLSSVACKKTETQSSSSITTIENTSYVLAENGETEYSIIIPNEASEYEEFAGKELQSLFKEATGAQMPILFDEGLTFAEDKKYISISDTTIEAQSGVVSDYAIYKESGTHIVNKGACVILTGSTDEGALYAVYDFLGVLFNYEYYDVDAYRLEKKDKVLLPKLDITNLPHNDYRMYGDYLQEEVAGGSKEHAWRLRLKVYGQGYALSGHAVDRLISYDKYYEAHNDWFGGDTLIVHNVTYSQLCYTNEEMKTEFIKNAKDYIVKAPEATIISLAQSDVNSWCTCAKCKEVMAQYGFSKYGQGDDIVESATQILFINDVVTQLNEWLREEYPQRRMKYMILAYQRSLEAPVHKDENGNYVVNGMENGDESLLLHKDVIVQFADVTADRNIAFRDNPIYRANIESWAKITKGLYIYEYPQDARNVCLPYDGLHVFGANLAYSYEVGLSTYFFQGNFNTMSSGFTPLKVYVASKLMWDTTLDSNDLAYDYIENCFGEASKYMRGYFDLLRLKLAYLRETSNYGASCLEDYLKLWTRDTIFSFAPFFEQAYEAIEPMRYIDENYYEALFRKIKIEEMFLNYVDCDLYLDYYTIEEKKQKIDDFELYAKKYGFKNYTESAAMSTKINKWRNS